jgi:PIN domain nuclease of toxin-antitoxin system
MNVLLDTCALLALAQGDLPDSAAGALRKAPEAYVSVVSPWEVAIKAAGGKLRLMGQPFQWFQGLVERY